MPKTIFLHQCFEVLLAESGNANPEVQVLRTGKFKHPQYGEFEITPQVLAEMKSNFDKKTRGIDIAFDYFHENLKLAAGWPKELELRNDGSELWAKKVEWTPRARQMLSDKELRYFSPEFLFKWTDPESGNQVSNILFGGGLTNRPFVKGMEPIVALGELAENDEMQSCVSSMIPDLVKQGHDQKEAIAIAYSKCGEKKLAEINTEKSKGGIKMDEKDKMIEELKKEIAALKAKYEGGEHAVQMQAVKDANQKLCEENEKLKDKIRLAEREAAFNVMLSEGKTCAAQKDAYLAGDMEKFIQLSAPVNLNPKGNGGNGDESDTEDKILKLAEQKIKADPTLDVGVAFSLAKKELKK